MLLDGARVEVGNTANRGLRPRQDDEASGLTPSFEVGEYGALLADSKGVDVVLSDAFAQFVCLIVNLSSTPTNGQGCGCCSYDLPVSPALVCN